MYTSLVAGSTSTAAAATELRRIETALRRTRPTDLEQELSVRAELEDHAVRLAAVGALTRLAAADPYVALVVDVAGRGRLDGHVIPATWADAHERSDVSLRIEFEDGGRRYAALAGRWGLTRAPSVMYFGSELGAVEQPEMILLHRRRCR